MSLVEPLIDGADDDVEKGQQVATSEEAFVDYVSPPRPPVPPPAKYKLCVAIFITIYFVAWFAGEAGIMPALMKGGLQPNLATFILFMIEVLVMVFFGVEPVVGLLRIKICGTWYGLLPWFMQPRCQWVQKSDNAFIQFLAVLVGILEDGFKIFHPPSIASPPPKISVFDLVHKDKEAVLKSKHQVNPEKTEEYSKWILAFINNMGLSRGFVEATKESEQDGLYTWVIRYENVNDLNNAMAAPFWQKKMQELPPLLDAQKVSQILAHTPPMNAFADMIVEGDSMPVLPPKKWKVWWITACALFFTNLFINATIRVYLVRWGVQTLHPEVARLVNIGILVLILNYIAIPFLQLIVYNWMRRKSGEDDTTFPWKQLNDGFPVPIQLLGFIIYFASTGAAWATR